MGMGSGDAELEQSHHRGAKPSARYGHAMAYDPGRGVTVLVGGWDIDTGDALADVWEWDPTTGAWTQRLTGSEPNLPPARMYASLVTDSAQGHLDLVGGLIPSYGNGLYRQPAGRRDLGVGSQATATFTDRTPPPHPAMAVAALVSRHGLLPATGKTYVFGGMDDNSTRCWTTCGSGMAALGPRFKRRTPRRPHGRGDGLRSSPQVAHCIRRHGQRGACPAGDGDVILGDTWEWNSGTRQVDPASPRVEPGASRLTRHGHRFGPGQAAALRRRKTHYAYTYPIPGRPRRWIP
jgi:hypothetical protein